MPQREPGAGLPLRHLRRGLQPGGSAQKLFGVGLVRLYQHEPEIEIGFKHSGLGGNGLAVGSNRVIGLACRVIQKSQVKPGGVVVGILLDDFFQQRLGSRVVLLFDRVLGLYEFWRGRGIVDRDFVMADRLTGALGLRI